MNWGRAKTILIIVFLIIDIILLGLFSYINNEINYIKTDTVKEAAAALKKHDIKISEDIVPKKRIEKKILNYENVLYNHEKALKRFLGEGYELFEETQNEKTYKKNNLYMTLSDGKMLLLKERNKNSAKSFDEIKKQVIADLEKFGYKKKEIGFENVSIKDGVCKFTVYQIYDKKKVYGTQMVTTADKDGILTLSGRCFSFTDAEDTNEMMTDVTTSLCDMLYEPSYKGMEIKDIEVMYYISPEYMDASNVSVYPVYVIKNSKKQEIILN